MKKDWNKPVLDVLDINMTMKFWPGWPGWDDDGKEPDPKPPLEELDS